MKLAYIHNASLPGIAANTVNVAKMCDAFKAAGYSVKLIIPRSGLDCPQQLGEKIQSYYGLRARPHVTFLPRLKVRGGGWLFSLAASVAARLSGITLIYTRDISVARAAQWLGMNVVFEAHGAIEDQGPHTRRDFMSCAADSTFKRLVVISQALAENFNQKFPWLESKILVAHDGADPVAPDIPPSTLTSDGFTVGYSGHLYPGKGMEIIAPLAGRCPWAQFHIYGGADAAVNEWRTRLQHLPNIIFHGHIAHSRLNHLLPHHDVVIAPYQRRVTISDGGRTDVAQWMSPLKIFEYMSIGRPIICSDIPVLREILKDEVTALLCSPDSVEQWEAALLRLRDEPSLRVFLGKSAQAEFLANYSWDSRAKRVLAGLG